MGQQHRKETKRRRRSAYIKRQKEIAKNSANAVPVQLATKVVKADAEPAKKVYPSRKSLTSFTFTNSNSSSKEHLIVSM